MSLLSGQADVDSAAADKAEGKDDNLDDRGSKDRTAAADEGNPEWNKNIEESMKERMGKFKDVNGLAKSYIQLEDKLAEGFKAPESDEDKAKLWAKLGRPKDANGYEFEGEDNLGFRAHAFELGFTQDQVTHHTQWFNGILERHGEALTEKSKASEVKLREKWGDKYTENIALANRELLVCYSEDLVDRLEQGGFLDDPEFIAHLHQVGKRSADDSIGNGGNLKEVERTQAGQPYLEFPSMKEYN